MNSHKKDSAQKIFDAVLASKETVVVGAGIDGCWLNSHVACKLLLEEGVEPRELILRPSDTLSAYVGGEYRPPVLSPRMPSGDEARRGLKFTWRSHVVPLVPTDGELMAIDPLLFNAPVKLSRYLGLFPKNAHRHIRLSAERTYAEDNYGKRTTGDLLKIIALRHKRGVAYIDRRAEALDCPPALLERASLGPTLGEFVRTHILHKRHPTRSGGLLPYRLDCGFAFC